MINKNDVKEAYSWILGRQPESNDVVGKWLDKGIDAMAFRTMLLESNEFRDKSKTESSKIDKVVSVASTDIKAIDEERLVFLHIPKTGGTTLHEFLCDFFDKEKICPARYDTLWDFKVGELVNYTFFSGHYSLPTCDLIPGVNNKVITFLREPKARLISAYYFWRSHVITSKSQQLPILTNRYSFCDFLELENIRNGANTFNPYIQLLTGCVPTGEFRKYGDISGLNSHDKILLEKAINKLDSLEFFGLLEEFDESVRRLSEKLNLNFKGRIEKKMVLKDLVNQGSNDFKSVVKETLTENHELLIERNTYLDELLFKYALSKFKNEI